MRLAPLPLLILAAACAASDADAPRFVPDFIGRSAVAECLPIPGLTARRSMIEDVITISDSSFLVLYAQDREVALVGPDLGIRRLVTLAEDGPSGVLGPTGAAVVGDTLLYVADQNRQALRRFDLAGGDRGTVHLPFPPQRVIAAGDRILITPLVIGRHPRWLVYDLVGDEPRPRPVPTAQYADPAVNALANMTGVAVFPDGRIVVAHSLVVPFAYVLAAGAPDSVERIALPLPDGARSKYGEIPQGPLDDERLDALLVGAQTAAPDTRTGDLLFLTRTGRRGENGPEKAIIRVDESLRYRSSYLLDVGAIHLAYLAGPKISLIVDREDRWYQCRTP